MFKSATFRLASSYLLIIMLMSIGFSIVFYNASWHELGRRVPPPNSYHNEATNEQEPHSEAAEYKLNQYFEKRIAESRDALFRRLLLLNASIFVAGGILSYYLARRTLAPIEANIEAQNQFVSDASHELRTPLTALQTTNEVALRKSKISNAETKEILERNIAEVVKLRMLTDSLLKLARADNGNRELENVELSDIVLDAVNSIIPAAQKKDIQVEDNVPNLHIIADRMNLTQAVATILDNAIKYSPKKSTVTITGEQKGKHALLHIKDRGIGISEDQLQHIFDRFYRVDESRNKTASDGFGIGLALAQKIIHQHHGEITVTSKKGKGTTFTVKLPLA